LYIAQPPLFKVKKGKSEQYIKDERQMAQFLLKKATESLVIETAKGEKITGKPLTAFMEKLIEMNGTFLKVNRHIQDPRILEYLLREKAGVKGFLAEPENVGGLVRYIESLGYKSEVSLDLEHGAQKVTYREGSQTPRTIGHLLLSGGEFQRLGALHKAVGESDPAPFVVRNGQPGETKLATRQALITHLMELGKKDLQISRYKGLGEMNPDQLWETTMDPEKRTLLQVQVNDKVFTDDIFTILMGDAVEPRRQFIEANALDVKNLDI